MPARRARPAFPAAGLLATAVLLCAAVVSPLARPEDRPAAAAAPDDRAISVGCWTVTSVEWNGKPMDPEILELLEVAFQADGSWAVRFKNIPVVEGKSTNRQDDSPKTFEIETLGSEGIEPSRYTGIYRIDGEIRVLCFVPAGEPRPAEFTAPRHSGRMLVTLARARRPACRRPAA